AGFCLPSVLPRTRCALTAPFQPCLLALRPPSPFRAAAGQDERQRCVFCATSPSSCPDRALPGALPCGVRTFLAPFSPRSSSALRQIIIAPQHLSTSAPQHGARSTE